MTDQQTPIALDDFQLDKVDDKVNIRMEKGEYNEYRTKEELEKAYKVWKDYLTQKDLRIGKTRVTRQVWIKVLEKAVKSYA